MESFTEGMIKIQAEKAKYRGEYIHRETRQKKESGYYTWNKKRLRVWLLHKIEPAVKTA